MKKRCKYNTVNKDIILEIVKNINYDFSVKDILKILEEKEESIAISTVYRIIDELLEENFIIKVLDKKNESNYRYILPCAVHNHLLLKCSKCSKVSHISCEIVEKLNSHILKNHNFRLEANNIFLPGICENCMKEEE